MAVLILTGNITDKTMGVIWPDKSSEKIEVKSDYAPRVNRLIGDILKDSGDMQAVNTRLTTWLTNSVRYDTVNKHDGYIDNYKSDITKKPGVNNNEIGLVNLPKLTIDATGTLVPNTSMQILTSQHVVRETGNAPETLKAPLLVPEVYDHVGHPIDPSSPLPSKFLMPINGTAASPVNIEINSEFFQALGFPADVSVKIDPVLPYNSEFNPRFDVTIQIGATPSLTGQLMRQNMGGSFSWVWTGDTDPLNNLKAFLDEYGGNNQKNAAFAAAVPAVKDQILIVKEMGDVLQVLLYLIWYLTDLNAYRNQPTLANVEDWKAQWRKEHCMITTDSVVYYMCIDFGLSCIYTGSREGLHGSRGGITLYKYVEAAETEADITNRYATMSAYYFDTALTSLNNTRLQILMMAGPGPDDTMRTGNLWFLATGPTTFSNSKQDRNIRGKAAAIKTALLAYAGDKYDSIVAQIQAIRDAFAEPGARPVFTANIAAYKKNVDDALHAYQRALADAYLPYMCLSVHMALNPNKGIESPDKSPIVRLGTGLNRILVDIISQAGGSINTSTGAAITSQIQSGGVLLTAHEIQTRYYSLIEPQWRERSYVIDRDNDYNGVMLFVATYQYFINTIEREVYHKYLQARGIYYVINLELCVSTLYDQLLLYMYYRTGQDQHFEQIILNAEILDNKSLPSILGYMHTSFGVHVDYPDEEETELPIQLIHNDEFADDELEDWDGHYDQPPTEMSDNSDDDSDLLNTVLNIYNKFGDKSKPNKSSNRTGKMGKPYTRRFMGLPDIKGVQKKGVEKKMRQKASSSKLAGQFNDTANIWSNWNSGYASGGKRTRRLPRRPKTRKNNKKRSHKKRSAPKRKTIKKR